MSMKQPESPQKAALCMLDIRMSLAVALCIVTGFFVPRLQVMTTCISCLLVTQDTSLICWKAGITRLIVTAIGGFVGVAVVALEMLVPTRWMVILLSAVGVSLTLMGCRLVKVPPFNARIGAVSFILVTLTLAGTEPRMMYAFIRLLSTFYGVIVVLLVNLAVKLITGLFSRKHPKSEEIAQ